MKNLQEATERICEIKGSLLALDVLLPALMQAQPARTHKTALETLDERAEVARTAMLHSSISEHVLASFERDIARSRTVLTALEKDSRSEEKGNSAIHVLLATTRISTFSGQMSLTGATGFFFRRGERLFLVSNGHVFVDAASEHFPDRIEIELHTDLVNLTRYVAFSIPLYREGMSLWRQATDSGGPVDVAVIEIDQTSLPDTVKLFAFDPSHLDSGAEEIIVGDPLTVIGFPLGFHDTVHHLAVARSASLASAYGVRFQQQGFFLTDARTHRGSSGSPVLRRRSAIGHSDSSLPWQLLGIHSIRMDMRTRDLIEDESLGLNGAWYADVLLTLTAPPSDD